MVSPSPEAAGPDVAGAFRQPPSRRRGRFAATLGLAFATLGFVVASPTSAKADLKLCNMTASRVGIAIGYRDASGWVAEGWWNIVSHSCETILVGELKSRFYYIHAVDYDRGGEWSGTAFMCTGKRAFTVRGVDDCDARGYRRTGFFEVDTREEPDWTIRLTDPEGTATGDQAKVTQ